MVALARLKASQLGSHSVQADDIPADSPTPSSSEFGSADSTIDDGSCLDSRELCSNSLMLEEGGKAKQDMFFTTVGSRDSFYLREKTQC